MKAHGHARCGTDSRELYKMRQLTAMLTASEFADCVRDQIALEGNTRFDAHALWFRRL